MHRVADEVQAAIDIPLLHIADATADAIKAAGSQKIGLLGTAFTMEQDFYRGRLEDKHGLEVITPDAAGRQIIHDVIYKELCLGQIKEASRQAFVEIIEDLRRQGAQGVILGCTEIGLLVRDQDTDMPLFDTTTIHAEAAVKFALAKDTAEV